MTWTSESSEQEWSHFPWSLSLLMTFLAGVTELLLFAFASIQLGLAFFQPTGFNLYFSEGYSKLCRNWSKTSS